MRLEISGSESLATRHSTQVKYQAILQFVGTPYHRIPLAYFATNSDFALFTLLGELTSVEENIFAQRSAPGLDGELHMSSFHYDLLLNEYYDPFLFVIVAFYLNMTSLVNPSISRCRTKEDWLPRHFYSLRALNEEALEGINCFPRDSHGKAVQLKEDLTKLYSLLAVDDIHQAIQSCANLFEERATLVFASISSLS